VRKQRCPRHQTETPHLGRSEQCDFDELLLGSRIVVDVGVAQEHWLLRQQKQVHRCEGFSARPQPDHLLDMPQDLSIAHRRRAAQHRIGLALPHQHGPDQRAVTPHLQLRQPQAAEFASRSAARGACTVMAKKWGARPRCWM